MADRLILVGRVAGAFGVRGEVRITSYTEEPLSLLGYKTLLGEDGAPALTLTSGRATKDAVIARAAEVASREDAEALRGLKLHVHREALPPAEEDEFYLADLIGLRAQSPEGEVLGVIKSVQNYRAGDLLEIDPGEGRPTWMLPLTREAVLEVQVSEGRIIAVPPKETE